MKIRASRSRIPTTSGSAFVTLGEQIDARDCGRRRPADHGRRADLRLDRRHGWRGVEHGGAGPEEARLAGELLRRLREIRARRAAAFRAGQMVSGGISAALGVTPVLAHGRRSAVARSAAGSPIRTATTASAPTRRGRFAEALASGWESKSGLRGDGLRRSAGNICSKERQLPINVDPLEQQAGRSGRAGAFAPSI